jgi:purine-binding chemotaxis protein CheW
MSDSDKTVDEYQFVSFFIDDTLYGFDVHLVKEITPLASITPIPLKDRTMHGLLNLRGQVILVLDVAAILEINDRETCPAQSRIVILKTNRELASVSNFSPNFSVDSIGNKPLGIAVDYVGDIVTVEKWRIEPPPSHVGVKHTPYIDGVIKLKQRPLIILNAGKIVSGV